MPPPVGGGRDACDGSDGRFGGSSFAVAAVAAVAGCCIVRSEKHKFRYVSQQDFPPGVSCPAFIFYVVLVKKPAGSDI